MPTEIVPSRIEGVRIWRPQVHADSRGRFVEVFRSSAVPEPMAQSNHSRSAAGALRGLHYHRHQADLWYLVSGRARVGLADLRRPVTAPVTQTFVLDGETPTAVYVPSGVAHGYLALTQIDLIYWVTSEYDPGDEHGVAWDDPTLAIDWQLDAAPLLSERDAQNPALQWDLIPAFS
jgi:dTDP-4-dehydrorhamnose 3,5-epimerase